MVLTPHMIHSSLLYGAFVVRGRQEYTWQRRTYTLATMAGKQWKGVHDAFLCTP